jgi:hypothetical protein
MLTDPTFYISMAQDESSYYSGVYLLLAVGILLFIVGFLGCCGALKESQVILVLVSLSFSALLHFYFFFQYHVVKGARVLSPP